MEQLQSQIYTPPIAPKIASPNTNLDADSDASSPANAIGGMIASWGFLACGIILVVAATVLPLSADLEWTRHQRDLALVIEQENIARNASYAGMIQALDRQDPDTLQLLAQANLGLIRADQDALVMPGVRSDPMLFELLEPEPLARPMFAPNYSRLERLVMVPKSRLWVLAGGIALVFVGLLPAARRTH